MKYNEALANRVREIMMDQPHVEEKWMFGCLAFMMHSKLCVGVRTDGLLVRTDPALRDDLLEQNGCREMQNGNRTMKGYVYVDEAVLQTSKALHYWMELALEYNERAKPAKKKAAKKST